MPLESISSGIWELSFGPRLRGSKFADRQAEPVIYNRKTLVEKMSPKEIAEAKLQHFLILLANWISNSVLNCAWISQFEFSETCAFM